MADFKDSKHVTAALLTAATILSGLWLLMPRRPKEYSSRLKGPQKALGEDVKMDLDMYEDDESWSVEEHPLSLVNAARIPYFDEVWRSKLLDEGRASQSECRTLDVGCGGGIATEALARLGWHIVGLDPAAGAIRSANQHATARGVSSVSYQVGSAYLLPFDSNTFHGAVSSDVLEHLEDVPACLAEIFRVMKPGGIFTFDTINRTIFSWYYTIVIPQHLLRIMPRDAHDWRMYITPDELRSALLQAGFEIEDGSPAWRGMGPTIRLPHQALWRTMKQRSLLGAIGPWQQVSANGLQTLNASYLGWARKPNSA
ncbi:unnamed protein product [Sympodiomycopsis kandeliae]